MARSAFWQWRHARPFWGGLFVFLSGAEIFLTVLAPLPVIVHVGMQGFIGYLLPILIALLGVLLLFNPQQHIFYSMVAAVLALASWLTSNLGGFVIGLILGVLGSAMAFAWSPDKHKPAPAPVAAEIEAEIEAEEDQESGGPAPGVQPETSQSLPRHKRPAPGLLSGE